MRSVLWRVAVAVLVFGASAAAMMTLRFSWTPKAESDRWAVSMAVATFLGGLTISALEWARRSGGERGSGTGAQATASSDTQQVTAGRGSENIVARGDISVAGTAVSGPAKRGAAAPLDQHVKAGRRSRNIVSGGNVVLPPEKGK